jgi:Glycosyltransferase family 9 (heptosyltransferase)
MKKFALIPARGLGDLMIVAGMAFNLSKKYKVQIYHPLIQRLHHLMPFVEAYDRPQNISDMHLHDVEDCVMIYEDSPFFDNLQPQLKNHFDQKFFVLNPVVTEKKDYKFADDFFFNIKRSFSQNLLDFALTHYLDAAEPKTSGIKHNFKKEPKLVVIHATASKESKSWFTQRFLHVKKKLEKQGFKVVFATLPHETKAIEQGLYSGLKTLEDLVENVAKAELVIGNESGVCHLASALGTRSLVLCRNPRIQRFWGADYEGASYPIFPPTWMINVKNLRIRDKYWRQLIFKSTVTSEAMKLLNS